MKTGRKVIRIILFFVIFILVIQALQIPFRDRNDIIAEIVDGFYSEKSNSLDAVYIGSSTTYAYWEGTAAWEKSGIAVYPLAIPALPAQSLKYMIIEARKTQENPLFILNLNTFATTRILPVYTHRVTNYLPWSANKLKIIDVLLDAAGTKGLDRMEYYFPIIRYHDEWKNLKANDVVREYYNYKGAMHFKFHLENTADISKWDRVVGTAESMTEDQKSILDDLLQYIKEENLQVLFVLVPNENKKAGELEQLNAVAQYAADAGFPVLNLVNRKDELGMDTTQDYYNEKHTNIHGALKYTGFLTDYLLENYSFEDKRGSEVYRSWDEASEKWKKQVASYALGFELDLEKRDSSLEAREVGLKKQDNSIVIRWRPVEGADTYHLYRKDSENNAWKWLADVPEGVLVYTDEGLKPGGMYTYTIVASRNEAGTVYYGNCNYTGKTAKMPK